MRSRLIGAVVVLIGCLALAPARADAHPAGHLESYRVLTYNVAGMDIPRVFGQGYLPLGEEYSGLDLELRAQRIADFIKQGDYDVVVINEAWDNPYPQDSMNYVLSAELASTYPYATDEIEGDEQNDVLDSGLMVFSKFPFVPAAGADADECETKAGSQCLVAFHEYESTACEDDFAGKGIGFVRLRNPRTESETNLFFTHMQNDTPKLCLGSASSLAAAQANAAQIPEIIEFIKTWAPQGDSSRDTLLAGDLNIHHADEDGTPTPAYDDLIASPATGLASIGLKDTWLQTAPTDPAATGTHGSLSKVDYILHRPPAVPKPSSDNPPAFGFCAQHLTVERQFFLHEPTDDGEVNEPASDHWPLAAVISHLAPHCSPITAVTDPPDGSVAGVITHPGSYQWYRFPKGGTYGFGAVSPAKLELTFYGESDLSTPLKPFDGNGAIPAGSRDNESVVVSPMGGFYLRVRAVDPAKPEFTGGYQLKVNRHDGTSPQEAIQLDPFYTYRGNQMTAAINPVSRVWFMLRTDTLSSGAQQRLHFQTGGPSGMSVRLQVFNKAAFDAGQQAALLTSNWSIPPDASAAIDTPDPNIPNDVSPLPAQGSTYYLTVEKTAASPPRPFGVSWSTNLFYVDLLDLHVADIEDSPDATENDEPEPIIIADGYQSDVPLGKLDDDANSTNGFPSKFQPVRVAKEVDVHMYEEDGDSGDCLTSPASSCDDMGYRSISPFNAVDPSTNAPVDPNHPNIDLDPVTRELPAFVNAADDDGEYTLTYRAYRRIDL